MTDTGELTSVRDLSLSVVDEGATLTLSVTGEVDLNNSDLLYDALHGALDSDAEQVVLDLRQVSFIDSSGLHVLLAAARRANAERRDLVVHRGSGAVARMLRLTAIDQTLRVLD